MNIFYKVILILTFAISLTKARAQDNSGAADLVKQGVALNKQGKYADAIAKFIDALKAEPENQQANYQMAFALFSSGKNKDAVPYAEKAAKAQGSIKLAIASYDLLGSIYDGDHQIKKAIDTYKEGIKIDSNYQRLHFNLGIAYFRNKQYAEAEASAVRAIKLDPKDASSQRMYALVTFHQNKRMNALMGFCSFILLEPNTERSTEAYYNIQHILHGGALRDANGQNAILLSPKGGQENEALNMAISVASMAGQKNNLKGMELLEFELKHIFNVVPQLTGKRADKTFFDQFFADYFYKLAQSDNMPAFTRLISLSANKDENTKWMADNDAKVKALDSWLAATPRPF